MDEVVVCFIHFVIAKNNMNILSFVRLLAINTVWQAVHVKLAEKIKIL